MFYYLQSVAKCYDTENYRYIRRGLAVPISENLAKSLVKEMHQGKCSRFIETGFSTSNFSDEELKEMEKKYRQALDNDEPTDNINNPLRYTIHAELIVFRTKTELNCDNEDEVDKEIIGGQTYYEL